MKRAFIIALAVLALPLLGAPQIIVHGGSLYQPVSWSFIVNGLLGFIGYK